MLTEVVELPEFARRAKQVMTEAERSDLIDYLAAHPEAGISLGNGLRKLRFARQGSGKSGGFRTIHYYQTGIAPLYLMTVYAKNEKANLSPADLSALHKLGDQLAAIHGDKS